MSKYAILRLEKKSFFDQFPYRYLFFPSPKLSPIFSNIIESNWSGHTHLMRSCYAGEIVAWPDQPDEIPEMHFPSSDEGAGQS